MFNFKRKTNLTKSLQRRRRSDSFFSLVDCFQWHEPEISDIVGGEEFVSSRRTSSLHRRPFTFGATFVLTILGSPSRYCDGVSRRSFLKVGALGLGGLTLQQLLRCEAAAGKGQSHKSVIIVYLSGGLAHQDTFDLKPDAPKEVRGEFNPINTNVAGVQVGELLPRLARCMDKIALVRSVTGLQDEHSTFQNMTGHNRNIAQPE